MATNEGKTTADLMREARVLLTDAFVLLGADDPGPDVRVDGALAAVWRERYVRLITRLQGVS